VKVNVQYSTSVAIGSSSLHCLFVLLLFLPGKARQGGEPECSEAFDERQGRQYMNRRVSACRSAICCVSHSAPKQNR